MVFVSWVVLYSRRQYRKCGWIPKSTDLYHIFTTNSLRTGMTTITYEVASKTFRIILSMHVPCVLVWWLTVLDSFSYEYLGRTTNLAYTWYMYHCYSHLLRTSKYVPGSTYRYQVRNNMVPGTTEYTCMISRELYWLANNTAVLIVHNPTRVDQRKKCWYTISAIKIKASTADLLFALKNGQGLAKPWGLKGEKYKALRYVKEIGW